jgi:hypothetical protein
MNELKAKLAEVAALMAALSAASAAAAVASAPKYTPIVASSAPTVSTPTTTAPTSTLTVNNNIVATKVDPYDVHLAVLSAAKYGAAVTAPTVNTTTLAGILAASAGNASPAPVKASGIIRAGGFRGALVD